MPALSRTASVGYLEEKIVPAVKAVHTQPYIHRLASTCIELLDEAGREKSARARARALEKNIAELDGDTVVSASSLSAALCAALSCCHAVDAVVDPHLPYANAFAVIRPPGHHAGANGPTVGPHRFAAVTGQCRSRGVGGGVRFAQQPAGPATAPTAARASACSTTRRSRRGARAVPRRRCAVSPSSTSTSTTATAPRRSAAGATSCTSPARCGRRRQRHFSTGHHDPAGGGAARQRAAAAGHHLRRVPRRL